MLPRPAPLLAGEIGEGAPHVHRLARGVAAGAGTAVAAGRGEVLPQLDSRTVAQAVGRHGISTEVATEVGT
jgi:hypothetical protein